MSLLLSATDVHFKTYIWATVIGLQWVWYQVWIGTVLDNVEAASNLDFSATSTKVNLGVAFGSTIVSLLAMYYIKKVVEKILKEDSERGKEKPKSEPLARVSNSDSTIPPDSPTNTELELPVGFARRFTPPSHALWTAHLQPKPEEEKPTEQPAATDSSTKDNSSHKRDSTHKDGSHKRDSQHKDSSQHKHEHKHEHKNEQDNQSIATAATQDEVVSLQDTTAGLFSGPLVDLEMVVKAVATARRGTEDPKKEGGEDTAKREEQHSSPPPTHSREGSSRKLRGDDTTVTVKKEEENSEPTGAEAV